MRQDKVGRVEYLAERSAAERRLSRTSGDGAFDGRLEETVISEYPKNDELPRDWDPPDGLH